MGVLEKAKSYVSEYSWAFRFAGAVDLAAVGYFAHGYQRVAIFAGALALYLGGAFKRARL